jgi:hypothetical protein
MNASAKKRWRRCDPQLSRNDAICSVYVARPFAALGAARRKQDTPAPAELMFTISVAFQRADKISPCVIDTCSGFGDKILLSPPNEVGDALTL